MRPNQKMMRPVALPALPRKKQEQPEASEPGAAVKAALADLEKKQQSVRALVGEKKLEEMFRRGRTLVEEIATRARAGAPAVHGNLPVAPQPPIRVEPAKIEEAQSKAMEGWKEIEAEVRKTLELRVRRMDDRRAALAEYLAARAKGLGSPDGPRGRRRG